MSSVIDFSTEMREQSTTGTVSTFEPYEQRRTRSFYARCFGLGEVFVEWNGVITDWGVDRVSDGFIVWLGRLNLTFNKPYSPGDNDAYLRTRNQFDDESDYGPQD